MMLRRRLIVTGLCMVGLGLLWAAAAAQDEEEPREEPVTKVYNVRDLVMPVPDFVGPTFAMAGARLDEAGAGEGGLFGDDDDDEAFRGAEETIMDLIDLIRQVIEPGSWDEGSGNAIRDRDGMIVATHQPAVHRRIEELLTGLRKNTRKMVSIHIQFVAPTRENMQLILKEKKLLAATAAEKDALAALAGPSLHEAKVLASEGQRTYVLTSETVEYARRFGADVEVDTMQPGMVADVRPLVAPDGTVMLNLRATLVKPVGKATAQTAPPIKFLSVRGSYRIPDGGMLLASGGTLMDTEPKEVYALIQVQVLPAAKQK